MPRTTSPGENAPPADACPGESRRYPPHVRILIGLAAGAVVGIGANLATTRWPGLEPRVQVAMKYLADPLGQVFLRMLFMVVVPLVFVSLTLGVAQLRDVRRLGRIGLRVLGYFVLVTTISVAIGLSLVNTIRPGVGFPPETQAKMSRAYGGDARSRLADASKEGFGIHTFVQIVPRNPIAAAASGDLLAVIFFSLVFGVALALIPRERSSPVLAVLEGASEAITTIVGFAMRLAPYAVAALIFGTTARFGWGLMESLFWYVTCVLVGLAILQFGVYSVLVSWLGGVPPREFFRRVTPVMVTAFSTSSSSATLPTTIKTAEEELGVPPPIAGFVLPLGATMNMNGTALFEGVTCVFLAQVFGVQLGIGQQLMVIVLSVLTAIGAAGVPGGSIPLLMLVLDTIGVPAGGIALVLGVDRILDMCRTVPNVTGDLSCALFIARLEKGRPWSMGPGSVDAGAEPSGVG